jgi:hypothetical protein
MRELIFAILLGAASLLAPEKADACTCEVFADGTQDPQCVAQKPSSSARSLRVRPASEAEGEDGSNAFIVTLRIERSWKERKSGEIDVQTDMTRRLEDAEKDLKVVKPK